MYTPRSNHVPGRSPARRTSPRPSGPGWRPVTPERRVPARPSGRPTPARPGVRPSGPKPGPKARPGLLPKALPRGSVAARVGAAARSAFPAAAGAAGAAAVVGGALVVAAGIADKLAAAGSSAKEEQLPPTRNPMLTYLGTFSHTGYTPPGNYTATPARGDFTSKLDYPGDGQQNQWLFQTRTRGASGPRDEKGWVRSQATTVKPGEFYYVQPEGDLWRRALSALYQDYYRRMEAYRNDTPDVLPVVVPGGSVWEWPVPLSPPVPLPTPVTYPLAPPQPQPNLKPRWRRRARQIEQVGSETAVELYPNAPPRVVPVSVPRKPGYRQKERKTYGKSRAIATIAFALYEAVDDWTDWVEIILAASDRTPDEVLSYRPQEQLAWMFDNPDFLVSVDWVVVVIELFGWAIDEYVGAKLGELIKRANRGIGGIIDLRAGVNIHYSQSAPAPGAYIADYIRTNLYGG